ncbi:DNA repair protein RadC [Marinospirillum sp.]|uniref:RadC family protein n=1 Tax=Marinospirillum sp. TaxID=2183934 RepID=UPI00286FEA97|nr:DNA repair protein RadC [Marinospirillum sp.]MDR9469310.1 DNA repair protein RadC [Marinospirillum sp.]
MGINHWPADERPREKLLEKGAASLSDAELLAIFLRTGVTGKSAVDLARHLLQEFGGLRPLLTAGQKEFCQHLGLGSAKFAQLQAVLEMAQRHLEAELKRGEGLTSPEAAGHYLKMQLRDLPHEVFALLLLDNQHRVLHFETLFRGTLDGASVYPREVVKLVLAHNAAAVILAHNHPSGIAEPSGSDEQITRRLKEALALVEVRVLDHLLIGDGEPVSFAARGLL